MPLPVYPPEMYAGLAYIVETNNLSTTKVKIDLTTTPAKSVVIQPVNLGSSSVKRVFVVTNALSDSEATTKLATPGQRFTCPIGDTLTLAFSDRVSRVDIISDITETGSNCVVLTSIGV